MNIDSENPRGRDERKDNRYLVRDLAAIFRESNKMLGPVLNLSLNGMLIYHEKPLEVNSIFNISLRHTLNAYSDYEGKAQVKWCRQNDISGLYGIGLEFLDNSEEQRIQIQKVVNTYAVVGV